MIRSAAGIDVGGTADAIARIQEGDGGIPWERGRHLDPWNHVEAAMALDVGERHRDAEAAYRWLASTQRSDGAWHASYLAGRPQTRMIDANFCAYAATGVWHHYLATGDEGFLAAMWPVVQRTIDFVLELQLPDGSIAWARDERYTPWMGALLTSSSSIHLSLRCAVTMATTLGHERPDWELSIISLGRAIREREWSFESKDRFAMDWYYPVLGTALRGDDARARLEEGWPIFVVDGYGVLCTSDKPWVTTGESAELVLACDSVGDAERARAIFHWLQHLRDDDGLYFTGANAPGGRPWPAGEKTTWSAGAVLLAADALFGEGPTAGLFRGEGLIAAPSVLGSLEDPV